MTSESMVYIAGAGYAPSPPEDSSEKPIIASLVSAATKALLDAGVTYDDVDQGVTSTPNKNSNYTSEAFKAFDEGGITIDEVETGSTLSNSFYLVKNRGAQCVLMVALEKSAAVAFVLTSDNFLWRHPYLTDSAALVSKQDSRASSSEGQLTERLYDICQMIWALRGWSNPRNPSSQEGRMIYRERSNQSFELSRADAKSVPEWKDVEYKQDGKHRLRHNPATETRDTTQEDFESVRALNRRRNAADDQVWFNRQGGDRAALAKL